MARRSKVTPWPEPTEEFERAVEVFGRRAPNIDALTNPWPSLAPTDDPVLRAHQIRFLFQRARYLAYLNEQMAALEVIEARCLAYEESKYRRRRSRAQSAIRRHRDEVITRHGYVCGICGGDIDPADMSIDHIMPITLGGTDDPDNMQPAHLRCNSRKGNRVDA